MNNIVATRYWHPVDDNRIQCDMCPRACKFCQNWDISKSREIDTLADSASPENLARSARQLNCRSIAFTYNDPVIFHEYAIDVAQACHEYDIKAVAVSAGYVCPEPRSEFYRYMDAANIDLKAFTEKFYRKITGSHLQAVLDTLVYLKHETSVWFEITNLIIPGENDSDEELHAMTGWIVENLGPDVPIHFTAFHPDWKMRDIPHTPSATLGRARDIAISNGIYYAYTGNVHDQVGGTTCCHHCNTPLIERDWYVINGWHLINGAVCPSCGAACHGVFEQEPGAWGARRMPVRLSA